MSVDPLADRILNELAHRPGSDQVVLGGYFVLQQHIDYRNTHDIDAWWRSRADAAAETSIRTAMQKVAQESGFRLSERNFGETVSFELYQGKSKVFSFQIAVRSLELEAPGSSPWPPILVETLNENVASKMNALVDRGSPRDFTDIYHVVKSRLMNADRCWSLWDRKNYQGSRDEARQKVLMHLNALELRRPLKRITDLAERHKAATVRDWFRQEFCRP